MGAGGAEAPCDLEASGVGSGGGGEGGGTGTSNAATDLIDCTTTSIPNALISAAIIAICSAATAARVKALVLRSTPIVA